MSVYFGKGTNQNCALLPAPSFLPSASPLFTLTLALAQIIYKNLSYLSRIVERVLKKLKFLTFLRERKKGANFRRMILMCI